MLFIWKQEEGVVERKEDKWKRGIWRSCCEYKANSQKPLTFSLIENRTFSTALDYYQVF